MKKKIALITGITGQDGSYLAEILLKKKYIVHGIKRRTSLFNTARIDHLYKSPDEKNRKFFLHHGDMTDSSSLFNIIQQSKPDEIYNLAAQSHVSVSFEEPEYTAQSDAIGTLRILEAIKSLGLEKKTKFYQASTSELYGNSPPPQNEQTIFSPRSPYAVAKLYAYWITKNYREAYNIFASNGILFNHESPRRGGTFVTKKIVNGLCKIKLGLQKTLFLGNLEAKRDWGHAKDYVIAMWKILQQKKADDFVIASGKQLTVKQFVNLVLQELNFKYKWKGKGKNSSCIISGTKNPIVKVDKNYFRPLEVDTLLGNSSKAKKLLKWKPTYNVKSMVREMVIEEINSMKNDKKNR